jgi:hypothetical protein
MSQMFLNIVSTFKNDGIAAATRQLGAFGKQTSGLGSSLGKVGAALASFGVISKTVQFTSQSIDSARDLERNLFSINTVFGDLAPKMIAFTKNAESIGLSQKDAAKASTFLGSVLKQSGFEMTFVQTETEKLVSLGQDLATTYGYDVQEALLGMTALFRGEYDPIEKFGVAMKQSEINSELAARGQDKLEGAARRNAEQTIRLELLYQRAADATGAFTKQSGNLYVEQKKLSAAWENMQATVGTQLLPAMGDLVDALKPLVDELTPRLVKAVNDSKPGLEVFTQLIRDIGDESTTTGATVSFFAEVLGQVFRLLAQNFGVLLQVTAAIIGIRTAIMLATVAYNAGTFAVKLYNAANLVTAAVFGKVTASAGIATVAVNLFRAALMLSGIGLVILALGAIAKGVTELDSTYRHTTPTVTSFGTAVLKTGQDAEWAAGKYGIAAKAAKDLAGVAAGLPKPTIGTGFGGADVNSWRSALPPAITDPFENLFDTDSDGGAAKKKKTPLADFLKKLREDGKRVQLEAKLIGAGLSEGLAKQLSSTLPIKKIEAVLKKIVETGGKYAKRLQKLWGMTAAGLAELSSGTAVTQQADEIKESNKTLQEGLKELLKLFKAPKAAIGAFQQQVVDAFEAINKTIFERKMNRRDKLYFLGISAFVQQQLEGIAKQRDQIADKIEKSKSFMASVVESIISPTDITKLGKSARAIVGNLKKTISQTLNFREQISQLSGLGLGENAIQQIVQAGALEGGQTAAALIAGGPEAINEINSLYAQLGTTANQFAETAGQAVYGAGVDISNGLINGLLAQDAKLREAATVLGNTFAKFFGKALGFSIRPETMDINAMGTTRAGTVINLTVTAPYNTRPEGFGRLIVEAISDFERRSGQVFVRA